MWKQVVIQNINKFSKLLVNQKLKCIQLSGDTGDNGDNGDSGNTGDSGDSIVETGCHTDCHTEYC